MINRIVKMTFAPEKTGLFREIFHASKEKIRNFEGCLHLELWESRKEPGVFFTYSKWESEMHLDAYRNSALFRDTWERTNVLFSARPEAWTLYPA
jgi:(4S)-4-hydroxy-5-phosphonooxypentane-2,3-dione isomerase